MKLLGSHEEFEGLLGRGEYEYEKLPAFTVVYFTASWCGACRSLNPDGIEFNTPGVNWLKCDVDQHGHTAGYCGIRSIPSFVAIKDKKVAGVIQASDDNKVIQWVKSLQ
jgi:thioredoxin 1